MCRDNRPFQIIKQYLQLTICLFTIDAMSHTKKTKLYKTIHQYN